MFPARVVSRGRGRGRGDVRAFSCSFLWFVFLLVLASQGRRVPCDASGCCLLRSVWVICSRWSRRRSLSRLCVFHSRSALRLVVEGVPLQHAARPAFLFLFRGCSVRSVCLLWLCRSRRASYTASPDNYAGFAGRRGRHFPARFVAFLRFSKTVSRKWLIYAGLRMFAITFFSKWLIYAGLRASLFRFYLV